MADWRMDCWYCQKAKRLIAYDVCIACDDIECNPIFDTQGTLTTNVPYDTYIVMKEVHSNEPKL